MRDLDPGKHFSVKEDVQWVKADLLKGNSIRHLLDISKRNGNTKAMILPLINDYDN